MKTATNPSSLATLFLVYRNALESLQIRMSDIELEACVMNIYHAMSGRSRAFHQIEHVLEVAHSLKPIQVLSALYHDTIYYQVDKGISANLDKTISQALEIRDGHFFMQSSLKSSKIRLVMECFDFNYGQELNIYGGMNEFLSAVVAVQDLGPHLNDVQVATLSSCIRATIPFQAQGKDGVTFPERIAATLTRLSVRDKWPSGTLIDEIVRLAVDVGNADVANFGDEDLAVFLDNTWKLLPETNSDLQSVGAYTISSYRVSLMKMEGFMKQLNPDVVFHEYKSYPDRHTFVLMQKTARKNITLAVDYLRAKLLSVAILEAIAQLTGGDAPIMLLAGASKETDPSAAQIPDLLEAPSKYRTDEFSGINESIYHVLKAGRLSTTTFDSKASPLAAFIYSVMGDGLLNSQISKAQMAFKGESTWNDFIRSFPKPLITDIIRAAGSVSAMRKERCERLAAQI